MVDFALIRDPETGGWSHFQRPLEVISTASVDEVLPALDRIDQAVGERGLVAVGYLSYEAAPAFDPAFRVHRPVRGLPLLSFGLFDAAPEEHEPRFTMPGPYELGEWSATQTEGEYRRSVGRVRDHIAAADTYQVNHTFRLRASFSGDPMALFLDLVRSQPSSYAAYLDLGGRSICSASPELLLRLDGEDLLCRPMKGTAPRGWSLESDRGLRSRLEASSKDRAENAMIVDMVRNDLGRVAEVGSVEVVSSFDVERHPTVFQMTSTVTAKSASPVSRIIAALFPFASVTGAPKVRTMELINELESDPRGVYTGAIGVIGPGRRARLSVAIRTAVVDVEAGRVEYGVGSGVVWDSRADDEYRECILKANVLTRSAPDFELLETMLWSSDRGFSLLGRHLDRMEGAAVYFGREFDRGAVEKTLHERAAVMSPGEHRVRLLVGADGSFRIEVCPEANEPEAPPVRLGLAVSPVDRENPFLHFKTTHRGVYESARGSRPDCDDVLLWNNRGEVTESTIANLVARIGGKLVTPPVESGLLAGTLRAELLDRGEIAEQVITVDEIANAEALYLINSVQGRRNVEWIDRRTHP